MWRRAFVIVALIAFFAGVSLSREAGSSDLARVVMDVARTIGALDLKSIQYSGSGFA
jgi:hypothetical protein